MNAPTAAELRRAYAGKRVLLTGHTGFKGSWLALWLAELGAEVTGYALAPDPMPSLYRAAGVEGVLRSVIADVRDLDRLRAAVAEAKPDFVFHLAAQPLVRRSYEVPVETVATNVLGTAHVLEALRLEARPCAAVIVTSDKCYENREREGGYREDEPMGGHDVYSMSKGAAELVVASFRRSFFGLGGDPPSPLRGEGRGERASPGIAVATARAGNVVGGGDWAKDRIVPDAIAALAAGKPIPVRNPRSVRPWQHVLEPLGGYLLLGARLAAGAPDRARFAEAWNFGPALGDARPVRDVVEALIGAWGSGSWEDRHDPRAPHEAGLLRLDVEKARARLGWSPRWRFEETFRRTVEWYRAFHEGASPGALAALCRRQIAEYQES